MLKHDIEARQPERQELADAKARFLAAGGQIEKHEIQMLEYTPQWNNRIHSEISAHIAEGRGRKRGR